MFQVHIVDISDKILFHGVAQSVMLPGVEGEFEVVDNHGPIAALLAPGAVTVLPDIKLKNYQTFVIEQGVMRFDGMELYAVVE